MTLALIHDWLNQMGGAEDVLEHLVRLFPGAPIYTSIYAPDLMPAAYRAWPIRTTWLNRAPGIHRHHQPYLPLYPLAFQTLDVRPHRLLLSNKSGFCHGVPKPPGAHHVCYCLTPTRYVWNFDDYAGREGLTSGVRAALRPVIRALQKWDWQAAQRVDTFIAISTEVQQRIKTLYGRDSHLIYPPVALARFAPRPAKGDYFLSLGRLIPYKRVDLAVRACTELNLPLKVAGSGRDRARLEKLAGPSVEFLGRVPDEAVPDLMAGARAFLFPGLEDFGITPVQALAAGTPVIAFDGGGARDTVKPGINGLLVREQTVEAFKAALLHFADLHFDPDTCRTSAETFDVPHFDRQLLATLTPLTTHH